VIRVATAAAVLLLALAGGGAAAIKPPAIQNGGTVVVGMLGGQPGALDPDRPIGGAGQANAEIWRAMCETLYDVAPDGSTVPMLASGPATISKDKLTVTIPIRKGILFNDGTPFNAQAVATTFERDITLPGSARATVLGPIGSATAPNATTVQLHMLSPNTALLGGLTNEHILSPTQLANLGTNFASDPVCVGPFMFQSETLLQTVTLVKSPYYYDKKDVHLDKLVFQYESSDIAAAAALESGDIQVLDQVPRDELKSVEDNGFRVTGSLAFGGWRIGINIGNVNGVNNLPYSAPSSPIGSSPKLREAFEMAIDRKTLNRVVFGGTNEPGCTPLSPAAVDWYAATSVPCTPYDPVQARKLVQAAGFTNPTVQMLCPSDVQGQTLAEFLQAEEKAVGINVVITPLDSATIGSRQSAGNFETYIALTSQVKSDPDWIFVSFLAGATGMLNNIWGEGNPSLVRDLHNGRLTVSHRARAAVYHAAQVAIMNDRPVIYLVHLINRTAYTNRLTGVSIRADQNVRVAFAAYKAGT
jgi:peptide/nickel transport system substrate-binding protein